MKVFLICLLLFPCMRLHSQQPVLSFGHKVASIEKSLVKLYAAPDGSTWVSLTGPDSVSRFQMMADGKPGRSFTQYAVQNNPDSLALPGQINAENLGYLTRHYINGYISGSKLLEMYAQGNNNDMIVYETDLVSGESRIAASAQFEEKETLFTHFSCGDTFYLLSHIQKTNKTRIYYFTPGKKNVSYREKTIDDAALMVENNSFFSHKSSFSNFLKQDFTVFQEAAGSYFPASYMNRNKVFIEKNGTIRFLFRDNYDSAVLLTINPHQFSHSVTSLHFRSAMKAQDIKLKNLITSNSCITGNRLTKFYLYRRGNMRYLRWANCNIETGEIAFSGEYSEGDTSVFNRGSISRFNYSRKADDREEPRDAQPLFHLMSEKGGFIYTKPGGGDTILFSIGALGNTYSALQIAASLIVSTLLTVGINAIDGIMGYGIVIFRNPNGFEVTLAGALHGNKPVVTPTGNHQQAAWMPVIDFIWQKKFSQKTLTGSAGADLPFFSIYNEQKHCFELYAYPF